MDTRQLDLQQRWSRERASWVLLRPLAGGVQHSRAAAAGRAVLGASRRGPGRQGPTAGRGRDRQRPAVQAHCSSAAEARLGGWVTLGTRPLRVEARPRLVKALSTGLARLCFAAHGGSGGPVPACL